MQLLKGQPLTSAKRLPIKAQVLRRERFGYYTLLINGREVRSKSAKAMEIGACYLLEAYYSEFGIRFKNLKPSPVFACHDEKELFAAACQGSQAFQSALIKKALKAKSAEDFARAKTLLLALQQGFIIFCLKVAPDTFAHFELGFGELKIFHQALGRILLSQKNFFCEFGTVASALNGHLLQNPMAQPFSMLLSSKAQA